MEEKTSTTPPRTAELERRFDKLRLTRESGIQPATLTIGKKTHPGMLPQSRALERADADNREGKDETVRTRGRDPLKPVVTIPEGRHSKDCVTRPVRAFQRRVHGRVCARQEKEAAHAVL